MFVALGYVVFMAYLIQQVAAGVRFAPWVPSRDGSATRALALAQFIPGERFLDLGSGDGRVVLEAAQTHHCSATGIERNGILYALATARARLSHSTARFFHGDLFAADLSSADIVYIYGLPNPLNGPLKVKLERELPARARVVSRAYQINAWPLCGVSFGLTPQDTLYLYRA